MSQPDRSERLLQELQALLASDNQPEPLMSVKDVCAYLNISDRTLRTKRALGEFPKARDIAGNTSKGKVLRWCKSDIDQWLQNQPLSFAIRSEPSPSEKFAQLALRGS